MGDVINLPAPEKPQYCYTCSCGCQVFTLRPDARIECAECDSICPQLLWGQYFVSPSGGMSSGPIPESLP